jgi:hypothetical protein
MNIPAGFERVNKTLCLPNNINQRRILTQLNPEKGRKISYSTAAEIQAFSNREQQAGS